MGDLRAWPDVGESGPSCKIQYPQDLKERHIAFDGTIEAIEPDSYPQFARAGKFRVSLRVHEVFRGEIDRFVVVSSWKSALPERDLTGTRILAALDPISELMGCGFTRPYSQQEARMWRETFAALPQEDCGTEVRDCDLGGDPTPVPAGCTRASFEYALASQIDEGNFAFKLMGCNERYLSLRVNLGDCPPEATKEELGDCAREKSAYFAMKSDRWHLLTYEDGTRCKSVQRLEPSFPTHFCRP